MRPLNSYNIIKDDWFFYQSKICSVACSLKYQEESDLENRINELTKSYLNQWQFVISAYNKLYNNFTELNQKSDTSTTKIFSEYDLYSVDKENDFRDYTYLLIISMKTFLDLFVCIVDIILSPKIKSENALPNFHFFCKPKHVSNNKIAKEFNEFYNKEKYPWINLLNESRNRIIHRGYHIKPEFSFKKGNELIMIIYKGIDMYSDIVRIEVGKLFNDFMNDMKVIDEKISDILLFDIADLNNQIKVDVSYEFGGGATKFSYKEL